MGFKPGRGLERLRSRRKRVFKYQEARILIQRVRIVMLRKKIHGCDLGTADEKGIDTLVQDLFHENDMLRSQCDSLLALLTNATESNESNDRDEDNASPQERDICIRVIRSALVLNDRLAAERNVLQALLNGDYYGHQDEQKPPTQNYELVERVGRGSFGSVYRGRDLATGTVVAIKTLKLNDVDNSFEEIMNEIQNQRLCDAPYITKLYGCFVKKEEIWIVMEYMDGGCAFDLAKSGTLQEYHIAVILRDSLRGLLYLHSNRIMHRDFKAGNILLSMDGDVKIADFGSSARLTEWASKRHSLVGTPCWMAPEVIEESEYNQSADIWSFGITAMELANGEPPYCNLHPMRVLSMVRRSPAPRLTADKWSDDFRQLVALCLNKSANERPSAIVLLDSIFIKGAPENSVLVEVIDRFTRNRRAVSDESSLRSDSQSMMMHSDWSFADSDKAEEKRLDEPLPTLVKPTVTPFEGFNGTTHETIRHTTSHSVLGNEIFVEVAAKPEYVSSQSDRAMAGAIESTELNTTVTVFRPEGNSTHSDISEISVEGLSASNDSFPALVPMDASLAVESQDKRGIGKGTAVFFAGKDAIPALRRYTPSPSNKETAEVIQGEAEESKKAADVIGGKGVFASRSFTSAPLCKKAGLAPLSQGQVDGIKKTGVAFGCAGVLFPMSSRSDPFNSEPTSASETTLESDETVDAKTKTFVSTAVWIRRNA